MCIIQFHNGMFKKFFVGLLQLSFIDLSPNYAGTLYSIANSLSCLFLIGSPYFTGIMIEEEV